MTKDEFWQHIRTTHRTDPEEHADRLALRLARLPVGEILSFGKWWQECKAAAYNWDLWGAAYLINGGCSDDGFSMFQDWLILQGRAVFEAAVADPDTLAAALDGDGEVEAECLPAYDAYRAVTGQDDYLEALRDRYPDLPDHPPLGPGWDFDDVDALRGRYPKLAAVYLTEDV